MEKLKVSIILSTYNEELAIEKTIKEILKYIENVEIIIVDDNSTDETPRILKKFNNENIKIFYRKKTKGLASAFLLGLINSSGNIVGWVDSNMTKVIKLFPNMIDELKSSDIVLLSRFINNGSDERNIIRKYASFCLNKITKFLLKSNINDLSSGIFVMHRKVLLDVVPIATGHGEFMIELLSNAEKKGNKVKEIAYTQPNDEEGNSKSYPNIFKFASLGFFYFIRVIQALIRRD